MDIDATVSGAAANSYLTVAEVDELLNGYSSADKWDELQDPDDKKRLLMIGTRRIDRFKNWPPGAVLGQRLTFPCSLDDPKTAIPEQVKRALLEFVDAALDGSLDALKTLQAEGVTNMSVLGQSTTFREDKSQLPAGARAELDVLWDGYNAPRLAERPYDGSKDCNSIFE